MVEEEEYELDNLEELSRHESGGDEVNYNRIINKVPDELKVYIQDKTFIQFEYEMKEFEKWKTKALEDGNRIQIALPDINVESTMPVDDIFEVNKNQEY